LLEDVEILSEDIPGWQVANQGKLTVALDITLTDALKEKGLARELVNRIQNIRKDKGFEITDRINVKIKGSEEVQRSIKNNFDYIRSEILAIQLELVEQLEGSDVISLEMDEALQVLTSVNKN
jgi:isoleucyl-tRNA synthetase